MTYESEYGDYTIPEEVLEHICEQGWEGFDIMSPCA